MRKNVLELKTAVRNRRPIFEAYREEDEPESPSATERMKLISAAVRKMKPDARADESAYDDMVNDILDAWFKGVSVLEIDWQMTQTPRLGRFLAPRCTRWVSPVSYAWSADLRLCLSNYEQNALSEIPDDKFLIARCKTKSGTILGGALLRPLVWWWCAANFSADWLLNLAQVFGLPFRWANYDPTAAPETVDRISSMLQNMGSAGWAAFPSGTTLELRTEGMKSGNQTPQGDMLDRADKQCDLLVLGQTLTTDTGGMGAGGGSKALGQVHQDVRGNVIDAAAKFVSGVLEQQLIPSILRLNFGNDDEAPTLTLAKAEQDDLTAKAAIIAQLKTAGAGAIIPLDWLGKTFGIPKPAEGEATLAEPKAAPPSYSQEDSVAAADWNPLQHLRDALGRFIPMPAGAAGPNGTTGTTERESDDEWKKKFAPKVETPQKPAEEDDAWRKKFPNTYRNPQQPAESACVPSGFAMAVLYTRGIMAPTYDEFIALEKQVALDISPNNKWGRYGPMANGSTKFPEIASQFGVTATPFVADDWAKVAKMASLATPVMATQKLGEGQYHQLVITGADADGNLSGWDPKGESFTKQPKSGINMKSFVQIKKSK